MSVWSIVPGPFPAIRGGDTVVALSGAGADEYAGLLEPVLAQGASVEDVLDVLVATGIAAAPDAVILHRRGGLLTAVARGRGRIRIVDHVGAERLIDGGATRTWRETTVGNAGLVIAGFDDDTTDAAPDERPAAAGRCTVSRILHRTDPPSADRPATEATVIPPATAAPTDEVTLGFVEAVPPVSDDIVIDDVPTGLSGIVCAAGHPNPPTRTTCVICGVGLARAAVASVGRPSLGTIQLPDGTRLPLGGEMIVGRSPRIERVEGHALPRLVRLAHSSADVSRNHARIFTEGWNVIVEDLGSSNGTVVIGADGSARHLRAGETALLTRGAVVDLGGVHLTVEGTP